MGVRFATINLSTKRNGREVEWQAEAKQIESLEDLLGLCGGNEQQAVEWANGHLATDAGNAGRPVVRNAAETVSDSDAIAKAQDATRTYSPQGARAPGVKTKAGFFDEILALQAGGASAEEINVKLAEYAQKFGA